MRKSFQSAEFGSPICDRANLLPRRTEHRDHAVRRGLTELFFLRFVTPSDEWEGKINHGEAHRFRHRQSGKGNRGIRSLSSACLSPDRGKTKFVPGRQERFRRSTGYSEAGSARCWTRSGQLPSASQFGILDSCAPEGERPDSFHCWNKRA